MILYDSQQWGTFWKVHGSVFPHAMLWAIPPSILAFLLKILEQQDLLTLHDFDIMKGSSVYSGFTFVLGFVLVFRTSESYNRYWNGATSVLEMRSEWYAACSSLMAFTKMSESDAKDISEFEHTMIRLFCLLHAFALEEIAGVLTEDFPLLDVNGLRKEDLEILTSDIGQGRKVEVVYQWIKTMIVRMMDPENGLLNVPAPILTRVFQELGSGLVHYREALQIVIWPFPFPYAQMCVVLLSVYMVITPVVVCLWATSPWVCAGFTFASVVCMKGLDLVASELQNPFGEDANDLPMVEMHVEFNQMLTMLVNPLTANVPKLLPTARKTYADLVAINEHAVFKFRAQSSDGLRDKNKTTERVDKIEKQRNWARQEWPRSANRTAHALGMGMESTKSIASGVREMQSSSMESVHVDDFVVGARPRQVESPQRSPRRLSPLRTSRSDLSLQPALSGLSLTESSSSACLAPVESEELDGHALDDSVPFENSALQNQQLLIPDLPESSGAPWLPQVSGASFWSGEDICSGKESRQVPRSLAKVPSISSGEEMVMTRHVPEPSGTLCASRGASDEQLRTAPLSTLPALLIAESRQAKALKNGRGTSGRLPSDDMV